MTAARPSLVRHAAPADWTRAQRGDLERQLSALGTSITELSDARELMGKPRLSSATPAERAMAAREVETPEVQTALARARACRTWLLEQLSELDSEIVRAARRDLGLRANRALRLGELSALFGWSLELVPAPARRQVDPQPYHPDADLYAAAGGV